MAITILQTAVTPYPTYVPMWFNVTSSNATQENMKFEPVF